MTPLERLCLALIIIFVFPSLGYLIRRKAEAGTIRLDADNLRRLHICLQSLAIFILMPFSALLSLWGLPRPDSSVFLLPALGLGAYVWGGFLAVIFARLMKMSASQTGSYFCCGTFSNIGAIGGLVSLIFLGENTIALVALYRILEEIFYFGIAFPIAASYAKAEEKNRSGFKKSRVYPALIAIVAGLSLGLWLNYAEIPRPAILGSVASAATLAATMILLFAIGLTLRISQVWRYRASALAICAIKFVGVPVAIVFLARILGLGAYDNGLVVKTVAIVSSMPVAMTALAPPALFRLDVDLANACWIVTTLALILTLPVTIGILPLI